MKFDLLSFIYCSISLTVESVIRRSDAVSSSSSSSSSLYLRRNTNVNNNINLNDRILQIDKVIRTDLVRLIPFDVQIAIEDDSSSSTGGDDLVSETLYKNGGSLLTDIITDWMMESFETKTSNQNQNNYNINNKQNQLVNNNTSFDSIALELIDETNSIGLINGQELNLIQVSFEGVSLWERIGTGTPPMEPEIVELIQRATFLEDKKLKEDLQSVVSNLLIDLGIDTEEDQQPSITIVDVRAYITPPSANSNSNSNSNSNTAGNSNSNNNNNNNGEQPSSTDGNNSNNNNSSSNENLEIIIIVAIVVACLAFVLLMFAVVWAWRSDRRDYDEKQSLASQGAGAGSLQQPKSSSSMSKKQLQQQRKSKRSSSNKSATSNSSSNNNKSKKKGMMNRKSNATQKRSVGRRNSRENDTAAAAGGGIDTSGAADFPDILNRSYPKEIGDTNNGYGNDGQGDSGNNNNQYPDSVISEDISTSLSAYYKSGMAYNAVGAPKHLSNGGEINDAASMSSMDSYGYSLDGYAPSLGPAQGGYPVGPLQAAKDLPVPVGDSSDTMDIVQLQQEIEEPEDYDAETPIKAAADADDNEA